MFHNKRGPFGGWFHGFGPGGFGPHFERGDIKFVILDLLKEKPGHGYEIIQDIEKRFHGFYSPSPGTVYPTLQLLEDEEYVSINQSSGKKVYTVTKKGLEYLKEHKEEVKDMQGRTNFPWQHHGELFHELREEIAETARLVFSNAAMGKISPEKIDKIHKAFTDFREDLEKIISKEK